MYSDPEKQELAEEERDEVVAIAASTLVEVREVQ